MASILASLIALGKSDTANQIAEKSESAARRSAAAAELSYELDKEEVRWDLCAYVLAVDAKVVGNRAIITVRNSGKTPAYNTFINAKICWEETTPCGAYLEKGEAAILGPGAEFQR